MSNQQAVFDPEIDAISKVYGALRDLDEASQSRVLNYVAQKLGTSVHRSKQSDFSDQDNGKEEKEQNKSEDRTERTDTAEQDDDLEGISVVARKWMTRNNLQAKTISNFFSLGIDDIDLVAKSVPGDSKKKRMRSVFLLKGVAAYLGSGAARFAHDAVRETCIHYDAWDTNNFARYFAELVTEVSGTKESGYTLTNRGLVAAAELIKEMAGA